jgi:hypothetical protein
MSFLDKVRKGMLGQNKGLPNGLKRANKYLFGIQKARYYLIGAESGAGKTTFADSLFLLNPYFWMKSPEGNRKIKWIYYSLEISKEAKMYTWMSYILDAAFGVKIDRNKLEGITDESLTEEEYKLVEECYPILEEMFKHVEFKDDFVTPSQIYNDLKTYAEDNGEFITEEYVDRQGIARTAVVDYVPEDPDLYTIVIIDHLALVSEENGMTIKQAMDKVSQFMVYFRNKCGFTPVIVQQFNAAMSSIERQKYKASALAPQREDFGDSKYTYRDADIVVAGIKPYYYDIPEYYGIKILGKQGLKDKVVFWHVIKNRYVSSKVVIPLIRGVVPKFVELPPPKSINYDDFSDS